jgi:hypothetical protein
MGVAVKAVKRLRQAYEAAVREAAVNEHNANRWMVAYEDAEGVLVSFVEWYDAQPTLVQPLPARLWTLAKQARAVVGEKESPGPLPHAASSASTTSPITEKSLPVPDSKEE